MPVHALSSSFSASIQKILDHASQFHKKYGFVVVVLDHNDRGADPAYEANTVSRVSAVLKRNVRFTDIIFQLSRDSWVVCLDDCDESFLHWSQFILQRVLQYYTTQNANASVRNLASVRGFFLPSPTVNQAIRTLEHEIQLARNELRQLKVMQSTVLGCETNPATNPDDLLSFVRQATLDNRLFLAFQPVVNRRSREIHYYECLARIIDKAGKVVPAGGFISLCEKTGMVPLVDQKIQQLAIQELKGNRNLRLAINVSAITAHDPQWLSTLRAQIAARPDLRGRLVVELTETSVFQNIDDSVRFIARLRDLGCDVSIDDFGAGYMSLAHLKPDLVQSVKIDAQFVKDLTPGSQNISFIRAVMALTRHQGIKCIAEGVENSETASILAQEHIDGFQGYYIGKPSPFREWV